MYRLSFKKQAISDLQKVDRITYRRIYKSLRRFQSNPLYFSKKIVDSDRLGAYRFRVGQYRILFNIEGDEIIVCRIAHRKDIYR